MRCDAHRKQVAALSPQILQQTHVSLEGRHSIPQLPALAPHVARMRYRKHGGGGPGPPRIKRQTAPPHLAPPCCTDPLAAAFPRPEMPFFSVPKEVAVGTAMLGVAFATGLLAGKRRALCSCWAAATSGAGARAAPCSLAGEIGAEVLSKAARCLPRDPGRAGAPCAALRAADAPVLGGVAELSGRVPRDTDRDGRRKPWGESAPWRRSASRRREG